MWLKYLESSFDKVHMQPDCKQKLFQTTQGKRKSIGRRSKIIRINNF